MIYSNIYIPIILGLTVLSVCELISIIYLLNEKSYVDVDLRNSTCFYSERIKQRLYFHICFKDKERVFDLRYFNKQEDKTLKPSIIGVQLDFDDFKRICSIII